MNKFERMFLFATVTAFSILEVSTARADSTPVDSASLATFQAAAKQVKAFADRLPKQQRQALSGGAQNMIQLAEQWEEIEPKLRQGVSREVGLRDTLSLPRGAPREERRVASRTRQVSDPGTDVLFSSFAGFTQSETSSAWCGNTVVVGFNDSGSIFESSAAPPRPGIGLSFNGVARSTNKGNTYTDLGFLNPGPLGNFLGGDPVLACADATTFYYASIFQTPGSSAISVSKSGDGGATFGNPVPAASKDFSHLLDKPWMTIDPTDANRLYVTYTDFDFSFSSATCGFTSRTAIELVSSADGGTTWSTPVVVAEVCGFEPFVQGSQVTVGPGGEVYVAWEAFASFFGTREIDIRKSTDHGSTFGFPVKVADVTPVGDKFRLQGNFRSAFEFPSLAVDRSGTATNGHVYLVWHNGSLTVGDQFSGTYSFADVLFSRSTDAGATWSAPIRVNNNREPLPPGFGTDQYQPGIAVDHTNGNLGVCFYDRRRDNLNFLIDRFCATSRNTGATWANSQQTNRSFAAVPGQDFLINPVYMGDYDTVASDFTKAHSGFLGAYGDNSGGNPDVRAVRLF